jgi:dTMP kinase
MNKKGTFVVIDGADGSGKATQTKLLAQRLKKEKKSVLLIDFPGYYRNLFGKLIGECLAGEHGDFVHSDPYVTSTLYAADRFESAEVIRKHLAKGGVVIADRYASSNQMHQGSKIKDTKERKKFLLWLDKMEYGVFKIPRPDLVLYLDVPVEVSRRLLQENGTKMAKKKRYLKGRKDVVENDDEYMSKSIKTASDIVRKKNNWKRISCVRGDQLRSREEIHGLVYDVVKKAI